MSKEILFALDASDAALKVVEHVAPLLDKDVKITLFHVLPKPPVLGVEANSFLTDHSPIFGENAAQFKTWMEHDSNVMKEVMQKAESILVNCGIDPQNISKKIEDSGFGVARDILEELGNGLYNTVVMGRRGLSGVGRFLMGSVSTKVIHHAKDCGVWIVE